MSDGATRTVEGIPSDAESGVRLGDDVPSSWDPEPAPPVAPISREQRRSRRKRGLRARTIDVKRMAKRELELGRALYPEDTRAERPKTRGECVGGARPCPFVSCKHHLALDVSVETGAIKLNTPDLEVWEMAETCALDVADRGGETLEHVGAILNITRERVRQVEMGAIARLAGSSCMSVLREFADEGPVLVEKRRLPILVDRDDEDEPDVEVDDLPVARRRPTLALVPTPVGGTPPVRSSTRHGLARGDQRSIAAIEYAQRQEAAILAAYRELYPQGEPPPGQRVAMFLRVAERAGINGGSPNARFLRVLRALRRAMTYETRGLHEEAT